MPRFADDEKKKKAQKEASAHLSEEENCVQKNFTEKRTYKLPLLLLLPLANSSFVGPYICKMLLPERRVRLRRDPPWQNNNGGFRGKSSLTANAREQHQFGGGLSLSRDKKCPPICCERAKAKSACVN